MNNDIQRPVMPLLGDKFPQMEVVTTHGVKVLPDDYKGKWFVFFSHPADFTPVCTTEFVAFQKRFDEFKALNTELIGFSVDQVVSHLKWVEWINDNLKVDIQFPVVADSGMVANKLGLIHPGKGTNTVRAVFIVDPEGVIRTTLYYPQELGRNFDEILRIVKGLQISDKEDVAIPANWPQNEIMGDDVIVPPATNIKAKEERLKQAENGEVKCIDWWLCHRSLNK